MNSLEQALFPPIVLCFFCGGGDKDPVCSSYKASILLAGQLQRDK